MISKINNVIKGYFEFNPQILKVRAKDLMPYFIKAGIFNKDHRNGKPIRDVLRDLDENNQLGMIPYVFPERKAKNTNWFFKRLE